MNEMLGLTLIELTDAVKARKISPVELMEAVLETFEIMKDPTWAQMLADSVEDIRAGRVRDHEAVKKEFL